MHVYNRLCSVALTAHINNQQVRTATSIPEALNELGFALKYVRDLTLLHQCEFENGSALSMAELYGYLLAELYVSSMGELYALFGAMKDSSQRKRGRRGF